MLSKSDYKTMNLIRKTPDGYFVENRLPERLKKDQIRMLLSLGYLESFTLEPFREEEPVRAAICGIRVSKDGRQEMLFFEKERSEKRMQVLQFLTATILALAAIPEVHDFVKWAVSAF